MEKEIIELYKRVSTDIPMDVKEALRKALNREKRGSLSHIALSDIMRNAKIAKEKELPLCQDTGVPVFYVKAPISANHHKIKQQIINATRKATLEIPLRPNAVKVTDEANTNDNVGLSKNKEEIEQPIIYIEQWERDYIEVELMLKGGGSENIGMQYKLPNKEFRADRNFEGVRKCVIDAVFKAQGKGCPPYIVGVVIGGSKDVIAQESKRQLLRKIDDTNTDDKIARLEKQLFLQINSLGIGCLGTGGRTTVLGVKIKAMHRHPASFFVDISFMCWACRRGKLIFRGEAEFS